MTKSPGFIRACPYIHRGGTFSKNLVLQLFSYVMVIVYEVFTHLRRQNAKLGPHPAKLLFGFHHYRAKKKVVVKSIYGYQNLSGEKCKTNGKRISSIRHTSEEKNPKNHPKMPNFRKVAFSDGFVDFSLHWCVRLS